MGGSGGRIGWANTKPDRPKTPTLVLTASTPQSSHSFHHHYEPYLQTLSSRIITKQCQPTTTGKWKLYPQLGIDFARTSFSLNKHRSTTQAKYDILEKESAQLEVEIPVRELAYSQTQGPLLSTPTHCFSSTEVAGGDDEDIRKLVEYLDIKLYQSRAPQRGIGMNTTII